MQWQRNRIRVRFPEVDGWGLAWHGNYFTWFEIGRSSLAGRFGMSPEILRDAGYIAPVIRVECDYKSPARHNDVLELRTTMEPLRTAALTFVFELRNVSTGALVARGRTTQVLQRADGVLLYRAPPELAGLLQEMSDWCAAEPPETQGEVEDPPPVEL